MVSQMIFPSKVKRYWPGKAPDWPHDDVGFQTALGGAFLEAQNVAVEGRRNPIAGRKTGTLELRADYSRVRRQAEILSTVVVVQNESEMQVDDATELEALEERRKRIRERQRLLSSELEEDLLTREDDNQDVMDMDQVESEYDAESEDQQTTALVLATPVGFVPKSQRDTFAELQPLEEEEKRFEELAKKRLERRKDETRRMVVELISREELHEADNPDLNEANSDSADDGFNEAAVEYEAWNGSVAK